MTDLVEIFDISRLKDLNCKKNFYKSLYRFILKYLTWKKDGWHCEVVDERLDGEDEGQLVVGREKPDEEVDDEKNCQRKVDLNRNRVFPIDTCFLLEVVSVWNERKLAFNSYCNNISFITLKNYFTLHY